MAGNVVKSKLVEEQINKLLSAYSQEAEKLPKSPMVANLLENESQGKNVHKLKQIFEEKFSNSSENNLSFDIERLVS